MNRPDRGKREKGWVCSCSEICLAHWKYCHACLNQRPSQIPNTSLPTTIKQEDKFDKEWNKEWNTFWKPLLITKGKWSERKIKNEMHDLVFVYRQISEVYCYITGGELSKPMYYADTIKTAYDDSISEVAREYAKEELEEQKQNLIDQTTERVVEEAKKEIDSYIDGCKSTDGFCEGCSLLGKIRIYLSSLPTQSITDTSLPTNKEYEE